MLYPKMTETREVFNLNGIWKMSVVDDNYVPLKPLKNCMYMAVPASINDIVTDKALKNYCGKILFERDFSLPVNEQNDYRLRLSAVSHKCEVFINGKKAGDGINGFLPVDLPLNSLSTDNRISVLIDNRLTPHTFPAGRVVDGKQIIKHDFYNFTGIHRDVLIYTLPKNHIEDIIIRTVVDGDYKKISVDVKGDVNGLAFTVFDEDKNVVYKGSDMVFCIDNPILWRVGKPYLYTLKVETDHDSYEESFGIRKIEVKGDHFLLNDEPVYFKGFGMHEDFFVLGKGASSAVNIRNFECLKWINANSFRTSHYPYSEEIMDLADKYGFLVIDELPAAGMVLWDQSFGGPGADGETLKLHKKLSELLYERDKNHPSVVMLSVANEPACFEPESDNYFKEITEYSRTFWEVPITIVDTWKAENSFAPKYVDVICVNRYLGWYTDHACLDVIEGQLTKDLSDFYEKYHKPVILSEFGADTIEGLHSLPEESFSEEFQYEYVKENCRVLDSLDFVIGEHVWNFADFKTAETPGRIRGNRKGVFTKERQPKFVAYYLKERWKNK